MSQAKCPSCQTPTIWDRDWSDDYDAPVRICRCCGYVAEIKRRASPKRDAKQAQLEATLQSLISERRRTDGETR